MPDQTRQPPSSTATAVMAAILLGAVILAVIGTFLPDLIGLTGLSAIAMQLVFYAIAAIDVAIAFWLRARIRKTKSSHTGGTVQRR
jgi:membrane protein implicated in regulation of membrane protease activity